MKIIFIALTTILIPAMLMAEEGSCENVVCAAVYPCHPDTGEILPEYESNDCCGMQYKVICESAVCASQTTELTDELKRKTKKIRRLKIELRKERNNS